MTVDDLDIAGLVYLVGRSKVWVAVVKRDSYQWIELADVSGVLGPVARLRDELADGVAVARRRLPELARFARSWGRALIPAAVLQNPPDVLLVVPHALLHGVPLHLVQADNGRALACCSGISYASSPTLLLRAATRNPARRPAHTERRQAWGGGADVLGEGADEFKRIAAEILSEFNVSAMEPFARREARAILSSDQHDIACIIGHGFIDPYHHGMSGILIEVESWNIRHEYIPDENVIHAADLDMPVREVPANMAPARPAQVLTLTEIEMAEPSYADLTILLACSSGTSEVMLGDEPASIAESLLRLGSTSVIAPMWACDYILGRNWIKSFLAAWNRDGMPKAMAAREAFRTLNDGSEVAELGPVHLRGDWL